MRRRAQGVATTAPAAITDAETRVTQDDHQSLRIWLRLLACTNLISNHVRLKLQERYAVTLPRFDLMSQLERSPAGLKMGELTRRLMVTGGNVTGITDALESEGLVVRVPDPDDGRAYRVRLTKDGARQFRRMAAEHERWVVALLRGMTSGQKDRLGDLLSDLKASVTKAASAVNGAGK